MAGNVLHPGVVRSLDRRHFRTDRGTNLQNGSRRRIYFPSSDHDSRLKVIRRHRLALCKIAGTGDLPRDPVQLTLHICRLFRAKR